VGGDIGREQIQDQLRISSQPGVSLTARCCKIFIPISRYVFFPQNCETAAFETTGSSLTQKALSGQMQHKVVLVGDSGVGKTSIMNRKTEDTFTLQS
jgi:polynucleotide 5'-kinase involved in rRNA processing